MKRQVEMLRTATAAAALLLAPALASANHPVLVEGELDFDGDGVVGLTEDDDGDAVFGSINRALGAAPAIGQNGTVVIVTSGRFPEVVTITGQVTLEAAPGVDAQIDAFLVPADARLNEFPTAQADPFALQARPGIIINAPPSRHVIIRNVGIVNWTDGIIIQGQSNVLLENVRSEHNISNGINIQDQAVVTIKNSQVTANGFRLNPRTGDFPGVVAPTPGLGISLGAQTVTAIRDSTITGNFLAGIAAAAGARLSLSDSLVFGNNRVAQLGVPTPPPPMMDDMMMMPDDGGMMMMDDGGAMMDDGGAMMDDGGAMMDDGGAMMDDGGAMMDDAPATDDGDGTVSLTADDSPGARLRAILSRLFQD